MKVILQKNIKQLGKVGEIIEVANGYANNYLLPNKIVVPANQGNEKIVAENLRQANKKKELVKKQAVQLAQKIKNQTITLKVKAAEKGNIFGTITPLQIAKAIIEKVDNLTLTHNQVILKESITTVGEYNVVLVLHPQVQTEITLHVKAT